MVIGETFLYFAKKIYPRESPRLEKLATMLPHGAAKLPKTDGSVNKAEITFSNQINETPYQTEKISLKELAHLNQAYIQFVATDAGAGHLRPAIALITSVLKKLNCVQIPTISTRTHRRGSVEGRDKRIIDFVYLHERFQKYVYAPISRHLLLNQDGATVVGALETLIQKSVSQGKNEIIFIHTNPDPAYIAGFYKHQLENKHNVKITNVVLITDHFITRVQCIWPLIDADIIFAPDNQTKKLIDRELSSWQKKMRRRRNDRREHLPRVTVCAYPQDPTFGLELDHKLREKRENNLSAESQQPIDVLIPLGGGSPGMPFLAKLTDNLKKLGEFNIDTLFKDANGDQETKDYAKAMNNCGAITHPVSNNQQLIEAYGNIFRSESVPDVVIVKPGELSNQTMFDPSQVGGAIFLFTEPVGDQEVQNLLFFQSDEGGNIIPDEKENQVLIDLILELVQGGADIANDNPQLKSFQEKAKKWRGLSLPKDPGQAAIFIVGLKKFGIFASMAQFKNDSTKSSAAMSTTGSQEFFTELNQAYGVHKNSLTH